MISQNKESPFLSNKTLVWGIGILFAVMGLGALILGNGTFSDVLRGYLSIEQFSNGESFNTLNYLVGSEKIAYFISWWTPAQYLFPYALAALSIPLWLGQGVLIIGCTGLSILGYYRLFDYFGFSKNLRLLSITLILSNQIFFWNTLLYYGGSLFELGLLPWFLLFLFRIKSSFNWKAALMYLSVGVSLFFFKATFLLHVGIGLAIMLVSFKKLKRSEIIWILISGISILAICYFSFLQWGETPSGTNDFEQYNSIPNNVLMDLTTPFASIFGIWTNISVLLQKLMPWWSGAIYLSYIVFPLLSVWGILFLRSVSRKDANAKNLVEYTVFFFAGFIYLYLNDKAVSYDARHFAPLLFCFVPFCLNQLEQWIKVKWLFQIGIGALLLFNVSLFVFQRYQFNNEMSKIEGMYFANRDAEAHSLLKEAIEQSPDNSTCIVIDSWPLKLTLGDKVNYVLHERNKKWVIKSGIEIPKPREFNFYEDLKNQENILVFLPKGNDSLLKKLVAYELKVIELHGNFTIYSGSRVI